MYVSIGLGFRLTCMAAAPLTPKPTDDTKPLNLSAGRLATALGGADTALRVVLGPPEAWRTAQETEVPKGAAAAVRIGGPRAHAPAPAAAGRFQALQEHFRRALSVSEGVQLQWSISSDSAHRR